MDDSSAYVPHVLVVADEWDEDGAMEVSHPDECPIEVGPHLTSYMCAVGYEVEANGLTWYFLHRDAPRDSLDGHVERLAPGRHEIEAWSVCHPSTPAGPEEWDGGLRIRPSADCNPGVGT